MAWRIANWLPLLQAFEKLYQEGAAQPEDLAAAQRKADRIRGEHDEARTAEAHEVERLHEDLAERQFTLASEADRLCKESDELQTTLASELEWLCKELTEQQTSRASKLAKLRAERDELRSQLTAVGRALEAAQVPKQLAAEESKG